MRRRNKERLTPAEEAVLRYQRGDAEAFFEVRERYAKYLDNFRGIFRETLKPKDLRRKSVRRFAERFIRRDRTRAINLVLFGWSLPEQPVVAEILRWLRASTQLAELEDMLAEIDLCLLERMAEYDPEKSDWDLFLFVRFQQRFVDHVKKWASPVMPETLDPVVVPYREEMNTDPYRPSVELQDELGAGWIWGIDCSPAFSVLTPFERWLLAQRFMGKRKISEIARQAGMAPREVSQRIRQAVARLEASGTFWHNLSRPQDEEATHEASRAAD